MSRASEPQIDAAQRLRLRAARWSLAVGLLVFGGKLAAYLLTDSTAVFSDAMESVVNIAAAAVLLLSLRLAAQPADRDHPYGHGKVEFFSAGIEGAFLLGAGIWIAVEAVGAFVVGSTVHSLNIGVAFLVGFSVINAALGVHLVRTGEATHSLALVADGKHVLADVWTTAGVIIGLAAVEVTGWGVLDPLIALAVAVNIMRESRNLLREAVRGLMDEADEPLLEEIAASFDVGRPAEWIDVHGLRSRRSGPLVHADLHLVVPRYFDVQRLHVLHEDIEIAVRQAVRGTAETVVHFDPCRVSDCPRCRVSHCPVRAAVPAGPGYEITLERATRSDATAEPDAEPVEANS
ncbi:MAG: cation diffusion facilitator family transporter [Planctomycetota bacterium]